MASTPKQSFDTLKQRCDILSKILKYIDRMDAQMSRSSLVNTVRMMDFGVLLSADQPIRKLLTLCSGVLLYCLRQTLGDESDLNQIFKQDQLIVLQEVKGPFVIRDPYIYLTFEHEVSDQQHFQILEAARRQQITKHRNLMYTYMIKRGSDASQIAIGLTKDRLYEIMANPRLLDCLPDPANTLLAFDLRHGTKCLSHVFKFVHQNFTDYVSSRASFTRTIQNIENNNHEESNLLGQINEVFSVRNEPISENFIILEQEEKMPTHNSMHFKATLANLQPVADTSRTRSLKKEQKNVKTPQKYIIKQPYEPFDESQSIVYESIPEINNNKPFEMLNKEKEPRSTTTLDLIFDSTPSEQESKNFGNYVKNLRKASIFQETISDIDPTPTGKGFRIRNSSSNMNKSANIRRNISVDSQKVTRRSILHSENFESSTKLQYSTQIKYSTKNLSNTSKVTADSPTSAFSITPQNKVDLIPQTWAVVSQQYNKTQQTKGFFQLWRKDIKMC